MDEKQLHKKRRRNQSFLPVVGKKKCDGDSQRVRVRGAQGGDLRATMDVIVAGNKSQKGQKSQKRSHIRSQLQTSKELLGNVQVT